MAKIIENRKGRRTVELNCEDVIDIVREYLNISTNCENTDEIRRKLKKTTFYLPEDL